MFNAEAGACGGPEGESRQERQEERAARLRSGGRLRASDQEDCPAGRPPAAYGGHVQSHVTSHVPSQVPSHAPCAATIAGGTRVPGATVRGAPGAADGDGGARAAVATEAESTCAGHATLSCARAAVGSGQVPCVDDSKDSKGSTESRGRKEGSKGSTETASQAGASKDKLWRGIEPRGTEPRSSFLQALQARGGGEDAVIDSAASKAAAMQVHIFFQTVLEHRYAFV